MKDWRIVAMLFIGGTVLTLARRWHNEEPSAGAGVAGGSILVIGLYLLVQL